MVANWYGLILTPSTVYDILHPSLSTVCMGLLALVTYMGKEIKCKLNTNVYRER